MKTGKIHLARPHWHRKGHSEHDCPQSPEICLYVEDLNVSFDGFKAINQLTFYLERGELRCFIGPNGAGKTTLMDIITGKTRPDSGSAWFKPQDDVLCDLLSMDEPAIAQAGIGRKFQKPSVFENLSVEQNLELALKGDKSVCHALRAKLSSEEKDFLYSILKRIRLQDKARLQSGELSHGQKQWLEIGMLLMQKPALLLLDEPVAGMTVQEIELTAELFNELKGEHTLMVIEHDIEFVRSIAKQVTVLSQGSVLAEGTMDELCRNPEVIKAYLGGDSDA